MQPMPQIKWNTTYALFAALLSKVSYIPGVSVKANVSPRIVHPR